MPSTLVKPANYRSLVGGYFSKTPDDLRIRRSIRTNNPLALNISDWQKSFPGYVGYTQADNSANANKTTIYETPENGFASWYQLMTIYNKGGHNTVAKIIDRYGGGQDYSGYLAFVLKHEPTLKGETRLNLHDDVMLLRLAKVMARHEAGADVPFPWSDQQILYGIKLGREFNGGPAVRAPAPQQQVPTSHTTVTTQGAGFWASLFGLIAALFGAGPKKVVSSRIMKRGHASPKGGDIWKLQERLRELGFVDIVVDGDFGSITDKAVRTFQDRENLDPDGEVGELTLEALNRPGAHTQNPPLMPPPTTSHGLPVDRPVHYILAEKEIGFKETGNNRGIERYIGGAKTGTIGDPWCAIFINFCLESAGADGSGSAMARSFESQSSKFTKLREPTLGCIVTMWRVSPASGSGHVFFYDGESTKGIRGIGGNEDNMVKRSFHDRSRVTGYYWPKSLPMPTSGKILVSDSGTVVNRSET